MLLTSLILSSSIADASLADLSLVKSRVIQWKGTFNLSQQELNGELARFKDSYGRQFTVIRCSLASELGGDQFADGGYALCRYNKDRVLDRVNTFLNFDARVRRQFTRHPFKSEGYLSGDTFTYKVDFGFKGANSILVSKVSDISSMAPYFSLLEAVVLFDYRPNADPLSLLNTNLAGGEPAVVKYGFSRVETGDDRRLLMPRQPGSYPDNSLADGAVDSAGNVYFNSMICSFVGTGGGRRSEQRPVYAIDGTQVRRVGDVSEEAIAEIKNLVPDEWREKPKD